MPNAQQVSRIATVSSGIIAGTAGGLAEIAWVTLYAGATGGNAAVLARGVTSAAGVTALLPQSPVALGVAVHMTLAVAGRDPRIRMARVADAEGGRRQTLSLHAGRPRRRMGHQLLRHPSDRQPRLRPHGAVRGEPDLEAPVRSGGGRSPAMAGRPRIHAGDEPRTPLPRQTPITATRRRQQGRPPPFPATAGGAADFLPPSIRP